MRIVVIPDLTLSHLDEAEIARIEAAFDGLPDEYRDVIVEACVLGKPHREIAGAMNRSEQAVRSLLQRARARLALLLRDAGRT